VVKLLPEFTGVNPNTGEYLSPDERKQVFKLRKRKLDPSKVFDKSAIVKVDKPQANMDSVMKSIANIQETLQKLQTIIVTDAEEKKKETTKENRQLLLAGEREKRKKKEGLLEKVPERLKNALLSPVKAVGEQAKGILSRLMAAFELIFVGWLTNKGFKAIQAFMDGDKEKLKSIGMNVLAGLGAVGGIFVAMNLGILALPAIIAKVIAVISTVGSAIIGFLLSPPGLITLAIAAGVGAAILGIKKIFQIGRGGKEAEEARHKNKMMLREAGILAYKKDGARVMRDGKKVFVKTENLTEEERSAREAFEIEQQRIKDITKKKNKEVSGTFDRVTKERESMDNPEWAKIMAVPDLDKRTKLISQFRKDTQQIVNDEKNRIREEAKGNYSNSSSDAISITPSSSNAANITKSTRERDLSAVDEMSPTVTVNNLQAKKDGDQPLKAGSQSDVPLLGSSNASNFYSTYSQLQYGVVV
tara:strand:+ start:46 stop:1464 length:1419 start_codon:yes stop_codon:yes gene_type:complete